MIMHNIPYEWVERLFGTYIAKNFNSINSVLMVIGLIIAIILGRKITFRIRNSQKYTFQVPTEDEDSDREWESHNEQPYAKKREKQTNSNYQAEHGEKSQTGWIYDRDTSKWDPPKSLQREAENKWRWDEEKRIWIDTEKEQRIERYRQWRREEGKEPTFEEWKAEKLRQQREKEEHPEK